MPAVCTVTPVLDAVVALSATDPHDLSDGTIYEDLATLIEARRRLDARLVAVLQVAQSRDVLADLAGRGARGWLVEDQRLSGADAGRLVRVARMLPVRPQVADALADGSVSVEHAAAILATGARLPAGERDLDEKILIDAARDLDVDTVRRLCQKVEDAAGANESRDARRERLHGNRYLKWADTIGGMLHLDGMLTPEAGAALRAALEPLAQKLGAEDERSVPQRRADALTTLCEAALGFDGLLPTFNGEQPHVTAIVDYGELVAGLLPHTDPRPAAERAGDPAPFTVNGTPITPTTVRQLACDAEILPVVMTGQSQVLDIGRASRIWPKAIRKALQLEDAGCGWPDCQMPLWACRIHHINWWERDHGPTSKTNGVHLCQLHHWLVHNKPWKIWRDTLGKIQVART